MSATTMQHFVDIPDDPALPGLPRCAQPETMLEMVRTATAGLGAQESADYTDCSLTEAVYQPGRACRIAYALSVRGIDRPEIVYARWPAESRTYASAIRVESGGDSFDLFRYPRDRRLRQIRAMRRDDWLIEASAEWFRRKLGDGRFTPESWRCSPIKYVPESRLVCRLKGAWETKAGTKWCRAYVRMSRRSNAEDQAELLNQLATVLKDADCGLAVPGALGALPAHHLLATDFIRGRILRDALVSGSGQDIAEACRRLAFISRLKIDLASAPVTGERAAPLTMLADLYSVLSATPGSSRTLDHWARTQPARPQVDALVHGDLHAGQVIQKNELLFVVDWDACRLGDPTQDITNLAAEFEYATRLTAGAACSRDIAAVCVEAWRTAGGVFNTRSARWWATHAFVLRAWGLLRHLRPGWRDAASRLLERSSEVYSGGADWTE